MRIYTRFIVCSFFKNITSEIALVDIMENQAKGEMMDLQQAACLLGSPKIEAGSGKNCM